ncbi:MAG: hypothetical protein BWY80_00246 [Firmicutes bacterium ADurb.Bin456]|nr:MAG: hypothetical protein BWY80_00246 [Firmicutes bacterium ADurb.Bin456]
MQPEAGDVIKKGSVLNHEYLLKVDIGCLFTGLLRVFHTCAIIRKCVFVCGQEKR